MCGGFSRRSVVVCVVEGLGLLMGVSGWVVFAALFRGLVLYCCACGLGMWMVSANLWCTMWEVDGRVRK